MGSEELRKIARRSDPDTRSKNHYHNPLNDQGFSGMGGTGLFSGESSIIWSQRPVGTQGHEGNYSWNDVRTYFYEALTAPDQITKERKLAETFRGLGQLMHLVQDLSVPEHSRDDGHYIGSLGLAVHYEQWVADPNNVKIDPESGELSVYGTSFVPLFFTFSELGNPSRFAPEAPVPVANLFDTNRYVLPDSSGVPDPSVTKDNAIGLSEYTNANFLSPDTMFTPSLPFPSIENCTITVDTRNSRQYFSSGGSGEHIDHLAATGYLTFWRQNFPGDVSHYPVALDPYCYEEYASHLIPRAVGYSAGLLKYFFRGKLDVKATPVYSNGAVTAVKTRIRNVTESQETMSSGDIVLGCAYQDSATREERFTDSSAVQLTEPLLFDGVTQKEFSFSEAIPVEDFGSIKCTLAFRGTLGNEEGAVIGKYVPLNKFDEEWDNGLYGNYPWVHTTEASQSENGSTYNDTEVVGDPPIDRLVKDNVRWQGYSDRPC